MRRRISTVGVACVFLFLVLPVRGQTSPVPSFGHPQEASLDKDPAAILEIGAATSWNVSGGAASFAPNFAVETTPIENWLELEAGVSPYFTQHSTSGIRTCCSRSRGPYLAKRSSCSALARNGSISDRMGQRPIQYPGRWRVISCSGLRANVALAGFSNRPTTIALLEVTNNRSA